MPNASTVRRPFRLLGALVVMGVVAVSCRYDPTAFLEQPSLSECLGRTATIGIGWHEAEGPDGDSDGHPGSTYVGTEGDDVVVIVSGPVVFDGLGGNDVMSPTAGAGDDIVWDRRWRTAAPPADQTVQVDLGPGADRFYGSAADDEVNGGGGVDDLHCGPGIDVRWTGTYTDPATTADHCESEQQGLGPVDEAAVQQIVDQFREDNDSFGTQLGLRVPGQPTSTWPPGSTIAASSLPLPCPPTAGSR
jgi:hypothetical protein